MSLKTAVWIGLFVGSTIGGLVPGIFGAELFSYAGLIGSIIGGALGIWIAYELAR